MDSNKSSHLRNTTLVGEYWAALAKLVGKIQRRYRRHTYIKFFFEEDFIKIKIHPAETELKLSVISDYPVSTSPLYCYEGRGEILGYCNKEFKALSELKTRLVEDLNTHLRMERKKDSLLLIIGKVGLIFGGAWLVYEIFTGQFVELDWSHLQSLLMVGLERVKSFFRDIINFIFILYNTKTS